VKLDNKSKNETGFFACFYVSGKKDMYGQTWPLHVFGRVFTASGWAFISRSQRCQNARAYWTSSSLIYWLSLCYKTFY